jgi:putative tricarboxylic transport membrane protein
MMSRALRSADFWAGIMFVTVGFFFFRYSSYMSLGTLAQMGPRYMPVIACAAMMIIGAILVVKGLIVHGGEQVEPVAIRPLIVVPAASVAFAAVYDLAGLMAASVALVLIVALAGMRFRLGEVLLLAIGLSALLYAIFIFGLRVQLSSWSAP